ncbi:MAG: hypothetical protein HY290_04925 [Planctomycetia bacterium]|nr:hypothetical protein [Planctomycetia bacterium]
MSSASSSSEPQRDLPELHLRQSEYLRPAKLQAALFIVAILAALTLLLLILPDESELKQATPGQGTVSLQLAADENEAAGLLFRWNKAKVLKAAIRSVQLDTGYFILSYVAVFLIAGFAVRTKLKCEDIASRAALRWFAVVYVVCLVGAALADSRYENPAQLRLLQQADGVTLGDKEQDTGQFVPLVRLHLPAIRQAAQIKFTLLTVVWGLLVAGTLGAARRIVFDRKQTASGAPKLKGDFDKLVKEERTLLGLCEVSKSSVWESEPWTSAVQTDLVGLAFSGGGIRSATFSLGLLQGLVGLNVLPLLHYLSTVSGGGYIGGWWSAWRLRIEEEHQAGLKKDPQHPVPPILPGARGQPEAEEVRHLREFSNFLAPRWGFFEIEMWTAFIAVLFGLVPTLLLALATLATMQLLWVSSTAYLSTGSLPLFLAAAVVPAAAVFVWGELAWRKRHLAQGADQGHEFAYELFAFLGLALVVGACVVFHRYSPTPDGSAWNRVYRWGGLSSPAVSDWIGWMRCLGATQLDNVTHFCPRLFDLPAIWLIAGALLSVVRLVSASTLTIEYARVWMPPVDRVLTRLMALAVAWGAAGLLWEAAVYLNSHDLTELAFGGAAGGAGTFALLRNWLVRVPRLSGSGGRVTKLLKPILPQVVAYATVALVYIVTASAALNLLGTSPVAWQWAWLAVVAVAALGLQLLPSEFGLHAFYRNRITRAYLGASNRAAHNEAGTAFAADKNRQTDLRPGDNLTLASLAGAPQPLHLVCCTANHLSGDQLSLLGRGGRSAVLSCHGISIGNNWAERPRLTLGSALTASAAAFNSEMGSVSAKVGPAVSFLMSALNLRLGLWVSHPSLTEDEPKWFPGLQFYNELFGLSDCLDPDAVDVHLSDGGHFENLALYELIRRHCRYIIVSDCGADPLVQFEDFGNAVRRIREDFGVDIEIDLDPLRPDSSGRSKQHAVVGTIRFDPGGGDRDVGTLVYFKPTLTGDEPCDIANYRTLNPAFPHETTGDQFYDEAQWESYRRLGSHAAFETFNFLEGRASPKVHAVFSEVRDRWYPTPPDFDQKLTAINQRFIDFDHRLAQSAPAGFLKQIFPELSTVTRAVQSAAQAAQPAAQTGVAGGQPSDEIAAELHLLLEMIQIMEDTFLSVDFRKNFNHPLMLGWVNVFHRWAHAPSFRLWWPILSPLYSPALRRFAEERFDLSHTALESVLKFDVALRSESAGDEEKRQFDEARKSLLQRAGIAPGKWEDGESIDFALFYLVGTIDGTTVRGPVGAARFQFKTERERRLAEWRDSHFLIIPGLWGAGLGGRFLKELIQRLPEASVSSAQEGQPAPSPIDTLRVVIDLNRTENTGYIRRDVGHRRERNDLLVFYKFHGFAAPAASQPSGEAENPMLIELERPLVMP